MFTSFLVSEDIVFSVIQLNEYETVPYFLQLIKGFSARQALREIRIFPTGVEVHLEDMF